MNVLKQATNFVKYFSKSNVIVSGRELRFKSRIGEGGYSFVYLVEDIATGVEYALKRILCHDEESEVLARKEIEIMKTIGPHPNIVRFYGFTEQIVHKPSSGIEFLLLLEYCAHGNLIDYINNLKPKKLPEHSILDIFLQICKALSVLHLREKPISHRDLKVENILLGIDGKQKLCDFGSCTTKAKVFKLIKEINLEEENIQRFTTSMYRAPEIVDLHSKQLVNEKVDIQALGCILYIMVFSKHPFINDSNLQILNCSYEMPDYREAFLTSNEIPELIKFILVADPSKRPNLLQVIDHVTYLLRGTGHSPKPSNVHNITRTVQKSPKVNIHQKNKNIKNHSKKIVKKHSIGLLNDKDKSLSDDDEHPQLQPYMPAHQILTNSNIPDVKNDSRRAANKSINIKRCSKHKKEIEIELIPCEFCKKKIIFSDYEAHTKLHLVSKNIGSPRTNIGTPALKKRNSKIKNNYSEQISVGGKEVKNENLNIESNSKHKSHHKKHFNDRFSCKDKLQTRDIIEKTQSVNNSNIDEHNWADFSFANFNSRELSSNSVYPTKHSSLKNMPKKSLSNSKIQINVNNDNRDSKSTNRNINQRDKAEGSNNSNSTNNQRKFDSNIDNSILLAHNEKNNVEIKKPITKVLNLNTFTDETKCSISNESVSEFKNIFDEVGIDSKIYLKNFLTEDLCVEDLFNLTESEIEKLIPKLGPRSRLLNQMRCNYHKYKFKSNIANTVLSPTMSSYIDKQILADPKKPRTLPKDYRSNAIFEYYEQKNKLHLTDKDDSLQPNTTKSSTLPKNYQYFGNAKDSDKLCSNLKNNSDTCLLSDDLEQLSLNAKINLKIRDENKQSNNLTNKQCSENNSKIYFKTSNDNSIEDQLCFDNS